MWWAGIAWHEWGLDVALADGGGHLLAPVSRYGARQMDELVALMREYAHRAPDGFAAVVDSTDGLVDGHLVAGGVPVYRADPAVLPGRPAFGSVPAEVLAHRAATGPAALSELSRAGGALAGRVQEYLDAVASCATVEQDLAGSGRYLTGGSGDAPVVALTFDDGPHGTFTPRVLDILARYRVPATFFCVGMNAAAYPGLVGRALAEGHGVGNHTWSHPYLPDLTRDELLRQVEATSTALGSARLFRPPYGSRTPQVLEWLAGAGMTTVLWDVDGRDWAAPGVPAITSEIRAATRNGSIILMHDGGGDRTQTVEALPVVLEDLLGRGYRFVTVPDLS